MVRSGLLKLVLVSVLLALNPWGPCALARDTGFVAATITLEQMPAQGVKTYHLIQQGGPFPFEKDGVVFGNRERFLPSQKRGYYREYTVQTPQSRGRGARRIVCGGQATQPETCYYTADHYASFRRIVP